MQKSKFKSDSEKGKKPSAYINWISKSERNRQIVAENSTGKGEKSYSNERTNRRQGRTSVNIHRFDVLIILYAVAVGMVSMTYFDGVRILFV